MERLIFHVDVNSAFLSWESAQRIKNGGEDLRTVPAVISGDDTRRTSVVLAKSIPAKKFGIQTGEPITMALRKCPSLVVAPPNFRLYERCSRAFMDICRAYAPAVQPFSIDECYMDMSGTALTYPDPVATAHEIKDKIRDTRGFTVNIGVGPNKLLAKMAGDFEKPDKVHTLFYHEIEEKMWPLPVKELLFVGKSTAEKLGKLGIHSIGQLAQMDESALMDYMGKKSGHQLHQYANGIDPSPVETEARQAKGYSAETTFEKDLTSAQEANRVLLDLCDTICRRMRADGARAWCVGVHIRSKDFSDRSHQRRLADPSDVTDEVFELCIQLFDELWDKKTPLRLLGAALMDVTREDAAQLSFFSDDRKERGQKLDKVMDSIRSRYGTDSISRAAVKTLSGRAALKHLARLEIEEGAGEEL